MSFFNRLEKISFKDILAILFSASFLFFCFYALKSEQALKLVNSLIAPIGIILTGYFATELSSTYINRSQERKNNMFEKSNSNNYLLQEDWRDKI